MDDEMNSARVEAQARRSELTEHMTVTEAENTVVHARIRELADEAANAHRRIAPARGRLTKARKDGSADKIAAARAHLDTVTREFEQISDANLQEMHTLNIASLDRVGQTFDLMSKSWDADARVTDAIRRGRTAPKEDA